MLSAANHRLIFKIHVGYKCLQFFQHGSKSGGIPFVFWCFLFLFISWEYKFCAVYTFVFKCSVRTHNIQTAFRFSSGVFYVYSSIESANFALSVRLYSNLVYVCSYCNMRVVQAAFCFSSGVFYVFQSCKFFAVYTFVFKYSVTTRNIQAVFLYSSGVFYV